MDCDIRHTKPGKKQNDNCISAEEWILKTCFKKR